MSEKKLIKKCQKGNKQAFNDLIRFHYDYVSSFLLKTVRDASLAEDLTQETFLKMIRGIDGFDVHGKAAFSTWLIAIAKNCYVDYLRRNHFSVEDEEALLLAIDDKSNVADEVEQKLQYEHVLAEVDALSLEQASAIRMKYVEDMTLAQIAEKQGVQPKTVKSRIHDGTAKLRKKLGQHTERQGREG